MHCGPHIRAAMLALLATALAVPVASADSTPLFEWSLPPRALNAGGRLVETGPAEVGKGPWRVDLEVAAAACAADATYRWSVDGEEIEPEPAGRCRFRYAFPDRGAHRVRLETGGGGEGASEEQTVTVGDLLVVSIGDSVASGEGVPDEADFGEAKWQSLRCHRSIHSGPARAAQLIEEDDEQSSVTFVHLACSGATVPKGLLGGYQGIEPPVNEPPLEPQVSVLNRIEARQPVDAVLLSIGANDIHFGDIVRFCLLHLTENCFEEPLPVKYGGDGAKSASEVIAESVAGLERRYDELDAAISPEIPRNRIYAVEYFDPTHDSDGSVCESILGTISAPELRLAKSEMLDPLNDALAAAVKKHGWDEVTGVAAAFHDHGYCAGAQTWITTLHRSAFDLGGGSLLGRVLGMMHPNERGYEATGNRIAASLQRDLFPGGVFAPRPDPTDDGGGGVDWILVAILALALVGLVLLIALWAFRKRPKEDPSAS
jgi:lysophospholipase L1-like esterase